MPDPVPDRRDSDLAWIPSPPRGIRPVSAAKHPVHRGQRLLVGNPGYGWIGDLRADDPVDHDGHRYIPVLDEGQWYQAERDDLDVFAPLVPIQRVWIDQLDPDLPAAASAGHMLDRLVDLATPPVRPAIPAREVPALTGRRVVVVGRNPHGEQIEHRDLRAVSDPHQTADGAVCVRVTKEPDWYRSRATGAAVLSNRIPIYLVWVEA